MKIYKFIKKFNIINNNNIFRIKFLEKIGNYPNFGFEQIFILKICLKKK